MRPSQMTGKKPGWGAQHVFLNRATKNWCLILIGPEHVTGNAWLFSWE